MSPRLPIVLLAALIILSTPLLALDVREIGRDVGLPPLRGRADTDFHNPLLSGGSMLTIVNGTFPQGLGEPMNIIISAESDSEVLVHSADNGGFLNLMLSTFLASECLGQHLGDTQAANLGESSGNVTQVEELRWDFNDPYLGTCRESFEGGLHARYWIQNSTGAYFIATSVEMNAESGHDIILDGYNLGRDFLAGNLTGQSIPTLNVSNSSTFSGVSTFANYTYQTDVKYVSGLLPYAADMINHYLTVESSDRPPIDGLVAVLTVKIISKPPSSAAFPINRTPVIGFILPLFIGLIALL